jgi:tol-pal system protein YbgF
LKRPLKSEAVKSSQVSMLSSIPVCRAFSPLVAVNVLKRTTLAIALVFVPQAPLIAGQSDEHKELSGTGFIVNRQGHVLTNHHVVDGCVSIRATIEGKQKELVLVGSDAKNDLAVLKVTSRIKHAARFGEGRSIRAGDRVVAVGYPLHGVLASEADITTGTVSALAGPGDDRRFLQITAPVQPGNSGGPLLDQNGFIVGILESRVNASAMFVLTEDLPQNADFAVNGAVAKAFLNAHNIKYDTGIPTLLLEPTDIGEAASRFTLLLQCYSETLEEGYQRLLAERRALDAQRRAIQERRVLLESGRVGEASKRAIEREIQEYERKAQRNAFDLAYNDFLNGNFPQAALAFQRVVKDYPLTTHTAKAHYWLGESFYHQNDYVQAMQTFEHVSNEYPGNEKVPASLLKLGLAAKKVGDGDKSKKSFNRVIEEFPSSDEAKLAKKKLAEFR